MLCEELLTSLSQMQPFTACLSPVAQVKWFTNEASFRAHFEFKVSTWPLSASWNSFFFSYYKLSFGPNVSPVSALAVFPRHFLKHYSHRCFSYCGVSFEDKTMIYLWFKGWQRFLPQKHIIPKHMKPTVVRLERQQRSFVHCWTTAHEMQLTHPM